MADFLDPIERFSLAGSSLIVEIAVDELDRLGQFQTVVGFLDIGGDLVTDLDRQVVEQRPRRDPLQPLDPDVVDPERLGHYNLSIGRVVDRLQTANVNVSAGVLGLSKKNYRIRTTGQFQATEDPLDVLMADDGIRHRFWVVADQQQIDTLTAAFANVPHLYIADGHHRSASASGVRELRKKANPDHNGNEAYNFFLAVMFPHDQMYIMDYNRVVFDLAGLEPEAFLVKVEEKFDT